MSITKDGFHKHIAGDNTYIGNNNYILLAGGGDIRLGNDVNQVPISNTTLNIGLNSDMLDGIHADELLTYFSTNGISSNENTLTLLNTYLTIGGSTYYTDIKTASIINSLSISRLSSDATTNLTIGMTINGVASSDKTVSELYATYTAQLLNARNITIGATTRSFNGTSNISWNIADIMNTSDIGSTTKPIYYNGTNFEACTYNVNANINSGTKNTLAYYSAVNTISSYTGNVGSGTKLFYLNSGVPTESSSTVGASDKPIYLNNGTLTASNSTIGSGVILTYLDSGTFKASTSTVGATNKPIYLNGGTLTASNSTIGDEVIPIYMSSGVLTSSTANVGNSTTGVYLAGGTITALTYSMNANINSGTKNTLAYYSAPNTISSFTLTKGSGIKLTYLDSGIPTESSSTIGASDNPIFLDEGTLTASTSTIGSGIIFTYMDSGTLKASTSTVGATNKPIFLSSGTLTASSSTIGSGIIPIYMSSGVLTASDSTVGSSTKPIFLSSGTLTASNSTIGSGIIPMYLSSGTLTASTSTVGASNKPIFLSSGTLTASSSTIGSGIIPIYMSSGTLTASNSTVGSATNGVYLNAGSITAMTYSLSSTVNSGTANRIAWYSGANAISSGSITTDGAYLGSVSYLSINTAHQTSYRLYVNGDSYISEYAGIGIVPNSSFARLMLPPNNVAINFQSSSYKTGVEYMTSGNEALVFASAQAITSFIFCTGLDLTNRSDYQNLGNVALQIKSNKVSIGAPVRGDSDSQTASLYVNGNVGIGMASPSYKLDVNGITRSTNFISSVATGTQPYACTSTTLNTNLNADLLDGIHANGLLTAASLGTSGNSTTISVTVGGTTKTGSVTVPYATSSTTAYKLHYESNDYLSTKEQIDAFHEAYTFKARLWNGDATGMGTSFPGAGNGIILDGGWSSTSYGFQLAIDDDPNYFMALRQRGGGTWNSWKRIPMGDGTGASGTWGISITGNAASATNSDTVDGFHAGNLVKFYLSPLEGNAPAASAKSWFTGTMPSAMAAIVYNVPGSEKTIIVGKSSGAYGHMLQLNYDDTYLRILRYAGGSWKSTDWEKISAGYADSAGNADTVDGYHASSFALSGHNHDSAYVKRGGDSVSGHYQFTGRVFSYNYGNQGSNAVAFMLDKPGSYYTGMGPNGVSDQIHFGPCNGDGTWVSGFNQKWDFQGNIYCVNAYGSSDMKLKYDIRDVLNKDVIDLFNTNNGFIRHFKWKDNNKDSYGVIAQEIQEYCPEAVDNSGDVLHVNYNIIYGKIIGALFKKVKELEAIIKNQNK